MWNIDFATHILIDGTGRQLILVKLGKERKLIDAFEFWQERTSPQTFGLSEAFARDIRVKILSHLGRQVRLQLIL